ncbi:AAA family ATPase [Sporosarcina limicola]|uniref:AAA15 family ATPase/GTPase n=1 Tax=Sporosarcina limicola TaxID=34101 RepID=A0A927MG93_9BACL|nr:ATP-binding protein [Sporosarcina limicola]MBE1554149.1 AAA15 family ATPase/GTPase [Sporosarcina limicola]
MLHQFTFSNFKSFKKTTTLDLIAASITEHAQDLANDCFDEKVLKVSAIFGANASGKSNVVKAFDFMRNNVLLSFFRSNDLDQDIETSNLTLDPFKFDNSIEPSDFEVLFSVDENIYNYGFSIDVDRIREEFLYVRDKKSKKEKFTNIFYRTGNDVEEVTGELKSVSNILKISKILGSRTLFLSFAANLEIPIARTVYEWFISSKVMDYGQDTSERLILNKRASPLVRLLQDDKQKLALENFVKAIDLGIEGFSLIENEILTPSGADTRYQVVSTHKNIDDGSLVAVPLHNESSGTKKMISLYIPISRALQEGSVLFVDELDAKLHPLLLRYLLILFHSNESNPKNAQLIFATHDVFSLDKSNFRRDEIWFVDKNDQGISDLYSLDSYLLEENGTTKKVRKDASYGKDYILGRYKSVPKLKSLMEE